jgi:hypothetical protein
VDRREIEMIKDFDLILAGGETYAVKFKETSDKSIVDEVCAFTNASGGRSCKTLLTSSTLVFRSKSKFMKTS